MVSDDTDHTVMVAQAILTVPDAPRRFALCLSRGMRGWLLSLPPGIGLATLRAILKLFIGIPPHLSGVASAGNGPAMRSAPMGAAFAGNPERRRAYIETATRMTHTDPRALIGATAVAELTAWAVREPLSDRPPLAEFIRHLRESGPDHEEWNGLVDAVERATVENRSVMDFARSIGLPNGVTGYVFHTVPVVAYAWYRHFGDFRKTLEAVFDCGGDTDTTGAIAGALAGAVTGKDGIPEDWMHPILDWPRGGRVLDELGRRLARYCRSRETLGPVPYFRPGLLLKNLFLLAVVLAHGFRRLLPPY